MCEVGWQEESNCEFPAACPLYLGKSQAIMIYALKEEHLNIFASNELFELVQGEFATEIQI